MRRLNSVAATPGFDNPRSSEICSFLTALLIETALTERNIKSPYRTQGRGIEVSAISPGNTVIMYYRGGRDRGGIRGPRGTGGRSVVEGRTCGPELPGPRMDVPKEGPRTRQGIGECDCVVCSRRRTAHSLR